MKKYVFKLLIEFEAFDDIDARKKQASFVDNGLDVLKMDELGIVKEMKVVKTGREGQGKKIVDYLE